jgi:hypothetical protein
LFTQVQLPFANKGPTLLLQIFRTGEDGPDDAFFYEAGSDIKHSRIKFSNFQLAPVKGWVTSEVHEKVNGVPAVVCFVCASCQKSVFNLPLLCARLLAHV